MSFAISSERAEQLGVRPDGLLDRLVDFADGVAEVTEMTSGWRDTLRAYVAALVMREQELHTARELRDTMRHTNAGGDGRGVVGAVDNALRAATWDPASIYLGIGAVAGPDVGNVHGTLVEELVIERNVAATSFGRHEAKATDRVDRPPTNRRPWLRRRQPPRQRALIAGCVGATRGVVLGLRPSSIRAAHDGSQQPWERELVRALDGERTDVCARAVVDQARAAAPAAMREPPVVSVLCDEEGWAALRRDLHDRQIRYALPLSADAGLGFWHDQRRQVDMGTVLYEAEQFFEQHPRTPFVVRLSGILDAGDPVPEWIVVMPQNTAQGRHAVWAISRQEDAGHERTPVLRRAEAAMRVAATFDGALLDRLHASGWAQQRAAGWLRHLAIVAIAHAFVVTQRPEPLARA